MTLERWHPELALANVGTRFPTWQEVLAIVVVDALLIVGTFFLFRRSIRRSRQPSRTAATPSSNPSEKDG